MKQNDIFKQLPYFTKQNLALAMGKSGDNMDYWAKKLAREGELIPLKKGFYISQYYLDLMSQEAKTRENYLEYLANVLRFPSYVSLEYVLSNCGLLPESSFAITSVTLKSTRVYESGVGSFSYRGISDSLFTNYQFKDFKDKKIKIASPAKALFDFLYLKNADFLKNEDRLNWDALSSADKEEFGVIVKISNSKKMQKIVLSLKRKGIL